MLALTRKVGDSIMIGINAPKEVSIFRKEIYLQIQEANKEAAANTNETIELLNNLI